MTDTPQGRSEANEATGEIRALQSGPPPRETRAGFSNRASDAPADDNAIAAELEAAGIEVWRLEPLRDERSEVKTSVRGGLHGWSFERAWRYWMARGPGIEVGAAERLHATHGRDVRVAGHCGCPSPREWYKGLAVGNYHVDSPAGLKALADTIRALVEAPPPPVSGGASTCDRPGQADAAVAEAVVTDAMVEAARRENCGELKAAPWIIRQMIAAALHAAPEAALRAAVPRGDEGWRPIETAPKDELVLVFEPHSMGGFIFVAYRSHGCEGGWHNNLDFKQQKPTHWRPLPAAPTAAPSKETGEGQDSKPISDARLNKLAEGELLESARMARELLVWRLRGVPAAAPSSPGREDGDVARTLSGETVCGFKVAAYRETDPTHGKKYGHRYSEHWSTPNSRHPNVLVERLFTEDQLRTALASREPTRLEGGVTQEQVEAAKDDEDCPLCDGQDLECPICAAAAASAAPSDAGGKEGRS